MEEIPTVDAISTARRVILEEAQALRVLADTIDESFQESLNIILQRTGRVAVTGMGKSGHIARKIAATLSSTGTPSFFIHPAEASHGDLGMLGSNDTVLAISNSGNTPELTDILRFSAANGLPVIAITHNPTSALARHAAACLLLPDVPEVAPLNFVPTTSTTMSLALGDALAMSLMTSRGITRRDFNEYHPGGSLGKKLRMVRDIMRTGDALPLVRLDDSCPEVLFEMTQKGFGCTGVIDADKRLVGIITDGDLRRHIGVDMLGLTAKDLMTSHPLVIDSYCLTEKARYIMQQKKITCLLITEGDMPVGIVNIHMLTVCDL